MAISAVPSSSNELGILISGGDEKAYEALKKTLFTQLTERNYFRVHGPAEMLEFLFQRGTYETAPQPDFIVLICANKDEELIEKIHDLCMVMGEKKQQPMLVVLTGNPPDERLKHSFRSADVDMVLHIDEIVDKRQDIKDLIIEGWFQN